MRYGLFADDAYASSSAAIMHPGSAPFLKGPQLERLSTQASTSLALSRNLVEMYQTSLLVAILGLKVRGHPPQYPPR
jgi:hypothetical protein